MLKNCTLHNTNKIIYYITFYYVCTYIWILCNRSGLQNAVLVTDYMLCYKECLHFSSYSFHTQWPVTLTFNRHWWIIRWQIINILLYLKKSVSVPLSAPHIPHGWSGIKPTPPWWETGWLSMWAVGWLSNGNGVGNSRTKYRKLLSFELWTLRPYCTIQNVDPHCVLTSSSTVFMCSNEMPSFIHFLSVWSYEFCLSY